MTPTLFRAALWAAVSSEAQAAAEKMSLVDQAERVRAVCQARGWSVVEELIVRGASREYSSIDAGMREIPELARLMDLARDGEINLLVCVDSNRFRGLQMAVLKTLAAYGVQTFSLAQNLEPTDPHEFRYFRSDTQSIMAHVGSLLSDVELSSLRRRYDTFMPRRLDRGLHWNNHLPFAYRKPQGREFDRQAVAEIVPGEAALLLEVKRRYERGDTGKAIADWLNGQNVKTERGHQWTHSDLNTVLFNPWYAGVVRRNVALVRRDLLTGKRVTKLRPRSEWILKPGNHQALWTWADYEHLWDLRTRRAARRLGATKSTRLFSRLLVCGECGQRLRVSNNLKDGTTVYGCVNGKSKDGHGRIHETAVMAEFRQWLATFATPMAAMPDPPASGLELASVRRALAENDAARARYQRALGRGALSDEDYDARLGELAVEREALERELDVAGAERRRVERAGRIRQDAAGLLAGLGNLAELPLAQANTRIAMVLGSMVVRGHAVTDIMGAE